MNHDNELNLEPYEHFMCQNCYHSIDHDEYYECHIHSDLDLSWCSSACSDLDPKSSIQVNYRLYKLEAKVDKIENMLNKIINGDANE